MNKNEAEALVATLSLIRKAKRKAREYRRDNPEEKPNSHIPIGPGEWELVNAENFILSVFKNNIDPVAVRDLYAFNIDTSGWCISWRPWSIEEEMEELKDDVFVQRFLENFDEENK